MFRKRVDPRTAAVFTIITLGAIQWVYWKNLVYVSPPWNRGQQGPPGGPPEEKAILGMGSVNVQRWVGDEPGYRDGKSWEARLAGPNALALLPDGNLVVSDSRNHRLRLISPTGSVSTLAGGGGQSTAPDSFHYPSGVAAGADGTIYVSDTGNQRICRIKAGTTTVLAGGTRGDHDGIGAAAQFDSPGACTLDHSGRLWVFDAGNGKLRSIKGDGVVSSPAAAPPEVDAVLGRMLIAEPLKVWGSDDGKSDPTPSKHELGKSGSAAVLPNGARVFGDVTNQVLLVQPRSHGPILCAGRMNAPGQGGIVVGGVDGPGYHASFATPAAVAVRADGTVYVADYDGNCIRRVRLPASLLR
jgi:sugar lactone lactonase YvrE